ncbi:MAG: hypothetical protein DMF50_07860 [Acidobacteria bacterium]|nr:MAG: hypothetical protein DMF50_07860 [Acidobacteriota bacterium]
MEKRLLLAVALSVAFLFLWTWYFTPRPPAGQPPAAPAASSASPAIAPAGTPGPGPAATIGEATSQTAQGATPGPATAAAPGLAGAAGAEEAAVAPAIASGERVMAEAEQEVVVETPLAEIRLSNRGAVITSWKLKAYHDDAGSPLQLVSPAGAKLNRRPLQLLLADEGSSERLGKALFRVTRGERAEDGRTITEVTFTFADGQGLAATKRLRVHHETYVAELEVRALAGGRPVTPTLVWGAGFGPHNGLESGRYADLPQSALDRDGRVGIVRQDAVKPDAPVTEAGTFTWAGLEDKYFAAMLVPVSPAAGQARIESLRLIEDGLEHYFVSFGLRLPGVSRYRLFVGPKDYQVLKGLDLGLERLLNFGFFAVIALPLFHAMKFLERYVGNYGWAIVILTFVIRLAFFPLMYKSQVKMRLMQEKMKRIQPRIKALRERYHRLEKKEAEKGNFRARHELRQRQNEEMMEIYKQEGINPLGSLSGCLPLLLQIPILYAFYSILSIAIELRKAPFVLWIKDLSQKDPYYVTPIVMGVTMLVQQIMTSSSIPDPAQRRMMYIMPVMFTWMFVQFPAGLVLYWLVSNLLGIAQQYLINRQADAEREAA